MTDTEAELDPEVFPFRFTCQRSGNCCSIPGGIVRVTEAEIRAIAKHLRMSETAFRSIYVAASGDRLVDGFASACVFLDDAGSESSCEIYPVRPRRCATWPYWPELRYDAETLRQAMACCPGIEPR